MYLRHFLTDVCGRRLCGLALLAAATLPLCSAVSAQERLKRSMSAEPLYRHLDKRDRPRTPERQTHRGWEVLRETFSIVCGTSREDALLAAASFEQAWSETTRLLDPWTTIHKQDNFAWGCAEVTIDHTPLRERDRPLTTLQMNNPLMIIYINAAPGQPSLQEQLPTLRMAAVYALMHSAQLDQQLPTWVRDGMAIYVAQKCDEVNGVVRPGNAQLAPLDSEYWQRKRVNRNELEVRPPQTVDSAGQFRFLVEGFDCRYAPQTFASLRQTVNQATPGADLELRNRQRGAVAQTPITAIDTLMSELQPQFQAWKRAPLAGQPILAPLNNDSQQVINAELEVALLLKLARRFHAIPAPASSDLAEAKDRLPVNSNFQPRVHMERNVKITEFKRGLPQQATPTLPETAVASTPPLNLRQMYDRMASETTPWATLDADRHLLISNNRERFEQLFGWATDSVSLGVQGNRTVIRKVLPEGGAVEGWLEENRQDSSRPYVRYALINAGAVPR